MSLFVSCGEVSGDLYAGDLIREVQAQDPSLRGRIWGMLGPVGMGALSGSPQPQPQDEDGPLPLWSYEELKLMGITEVLSAVPRLLRLRNAIARAIQSRRPRAVVLVDSPDFHLNLARKLRRDGFRGKLVCLVTPTVWAWRSGRTKILREAFDLCLPLFSFEHEFLIKRGVRSRWVAHPLVESMKYCRAPEVLTSREDAGRLIALMPGSRSYDIRYHLKALIETAELLRTEGFSPIFSVASGLSPDLKDRLRRALVGFETWEGTARELMAAASAAVVVSGTVSVEALLLRRFAVVVYNGEGLSWLLARLLVRIPYISIPNYLTDTPLYPELLRSRMTPALILAELHRYLDDPALKRSLDERMKDACSAMGAGSAAAFWAKSVLE